LPSVSLQAIPLVLTILVAIPFLALIEGVYFSIMIGIGWICLHTQLSIIAFLIGVAISFAFVDIVLDREMSPMVALGRLYTRLAK
jgi:hypothetical protein